jgi:cell division protein FtsL
MSDISYKNGHKYQPQQQPVVINNYIESFSFGSKVKIGLAILFVLFVTVYLVYVYVSQIYELRPVYDMVNSYVEHVNEKLRGFYPKFKTRDYNVFVEI